MVAILLVLFLWIIPVILGGLMGNSRNKLAAGIILPLFLGWIGVIIIACLSDRSSHVIVNNSTVVNPQLEYQGKAAYDPDPQAMQQYPTQTDKNYDRFND